MLSKITDLLISDIPVDQRRAFVRILFRAIFFFHIAWACGWMTGVGIPGFAKADEVLGVKKELAVDLQDVKDSVITLQTAVSRGQKIQIRTAYEAELRRLNQEIFALGVRVQEIRSLNARVDRIYDERLNDLREERDRVERNLQAFMRANPDIAGATF